MRVRKRYLPPGWYPATAERTKAFIEEKAGALEPGRGVAGIVPHAGWEFSGALALDVLCGLERGIDTIVIIGGHLGPADGILSAFEDAYETPLGPVAADLDLLKDLQSLLPVGEDRHADNTVEIQLPFIRYLFPEAKALGMRAAPSPEAVSLGRAICAAAGKAGKRVVVVGSTDLTHYGLNYGFQPAGAGEKALRWVREDNDSRIIAELLSMQADRALEAALRDRSACSAGGAVAALAFAKEKGVKQGRLVRYQTSCDVYPSDSFVGYAGIIY